MRNQNTYLESGVLSQLTETKVSVLLISYLLLHPLMFFAADGYLSFIMGSGANAQVAQQWGSLAGSSADTLPHKLMLISVLCVIAGVVASKWRQVVQSCVEMKVFVALSVLAFASTIWSQYPGETFRNAIYLTLNLLFAFYLTRRFAPVDQLKLFLLLGLFVGVLSAMLAIALPQYGVDNAASKYSWEGICLRKNSFGETMAFLLTPAFFVKPKGFLQSCMRFGYAAFCLFLIAMSQSRTAWVIAVIYCSFTGFVQILRRFKRGDALLLVLVIGLGVTGVAAALITNMAAILALLGKDATLTGRTDIWNAVMLSILKRPFFGYGFSAFWNGLEGESASVVLAVHWLVRYAHNGFLEVWLQLGLVGLLLVCATIVKAFRDALICFRAQSPNYAFWCLSVVVLMLLYNIDECRFLYQNTIEWILYVVACVGLSTEAKKITDGLSAKRMKTRAAFDAVLVRRGSPPVQVFTNTF